MFQFELVVTEKCNLKCKYCYMKNNPTWMSKDVFKCHYNMLPKIMEDYGEKQFMTVFFGGEPLLNWDVIVFATELIKYNPCHAGFIMPTNGLLLTPDKIDYLQKNNINISLSFDGLWNKDKRVDINGKSTFDVYMKMFIE